MKLEWEERTGRNDEGDKYHDWILIDRDTERVYASVACPLFDGADYIVELYAFSPNQYCRRYNTLEAAKIYAEEASRMSGWRELSDDLEWRKELKKIKAKVVRTEA